MYNTARFNLQRFNLSSETETEIVFQGNITEAFGCAIGYGENVYFSDNADIQLMAKVMVDPGNNMKGLVEETVGVGVIILADYFTSGNSHESVLCISNLGSDCYNIQSYDEAVSQNVYVSEDLYHIFSAAYSAQCDISLGTEYYMPLSILYEIISGDIVSVHFVDYVTSLNITIPPGSTLIIDSDNFVVLLDGENAIHLHEGDWLELCRDTYDVEVQLGQRAPIEVTMLCQELYL